MPGSSIKNEMQKKKKETFNEQFNRKVCRMIRAQSRLWAGGHTYLFAIKFL